MKKAECRMQKLTAAAPEPGSAFLILHSSFCILPPRLLPGILALAFYAVYVWHWVRIGKSENILWVCHLGCLLVGVGWLAGWPLANAIGLLWLLPGICFWGIYLAGGGDFNFPSLLTHAGGNALGLWGAATLGIPEGAWWKAGLGYAGMMLISSRVSRPSENVNFSRQVWTGWERRFPSYRRYVAGLVLGAFALFFALERALGWLLPRG